MELEITCSKCKKLYYIVLKEWEKIAKPAIRDKIDFCDTEVDLKEKNIETICPNCLNKNKNELNDLGISTYILYMTDIKNCDKEENTKRANEILNEFRKETEIENNLNVKLMMKKLHNIHVREIDSRCSNNTFNLEDFNNAVEIIKNN